jgi:hypothetical protein
MTRLLLGARAASPASPWASRSLAQFEPDSVRRLGPRGAVPAGSRSRARVASVLAFRAPAGRARVASGSRVLRAGAVPASISGRTTRRGSPRPLLFSIYETGTLYDFSFCFSLSLTNTTNMPFAIACSYCSFKEV